MNRQELEARIAALGRPSPLNGITSSTERDERIQRVGSRLGLLLASSAAAKAWDAAHPDKAAEYHRLAAELEVEVRRGDREERERAAIDKALRTMGAKLERSGVGERALSAAAAAEDTEALGIVKRWLEDHSLTWLALCGTKGTGKSVAATWAVREAIRSGGSGAFRRAFEIAKLSGFDVGAAELEHLKRVNLLVVDDFGTELLSDYARAQFHELFDYRHENYGRTIITSNLPWITTTRDGETRPGLKDRLGERLVDRFEQCGRLGQLSARPSLRKRGDR